MKSISETVSQKIKLPSNSQIVTSTSLWNFMKAMSNTGDTFTKEQLKIKLKIKSDDTIKRNLSYLKYLGIIEESRKIGKKGEKNQDTQQFNWKKSDNITKLKNFLRGDYEDKAIDEFKNIILAHPLFKTITDKFFGEEKIKTLVDLENFLNEESGGKKGSYYKGGSDFLSDLLNKAGLISKNNDQIEIITESFNVINESEKPVDEIYKKNEMIDLSNNSYQVIIKGPGLETNVIVNDSDDLDLIKTIMEKIRKKIGEQSDEAN